MSVGLVVLGALAIGSLDRPLGPEADGRASQDEHYAVHGPSVLRYETAEEARKRATNVLEVVVDHVALPRGRTGGPCRVEGEVVRVVRGAGLTPRGRIALTIPCVARSRPGTPRRILEGEFVKGVSSLFYFSERQELLDIARIRP